MAGLAAAAVLAVVVGVSLVTGLGGPGDDPGDDPGERRPGDTAGDGSSPPPGTRLVGIGHLAVAVPEEWGRNQIECGTPQADTVVIDLGAVCLALVPRPRDVESVQLLRGRPGGAEGPDAPETTSVQVAGRQAERTAVQCRAQDFGPPVEVCRAWLHFPDEDVAFMVESSSSDARAQVDEMLGWVLLVEDRVAVPGVESINLDVQTEDPLGNAGERYVAALRALGLSPETVTEPRPRAEAGRILGVEPVPGTMLEPGASVTVTVAGRG